MKLIEHRDRALGFYRELRAALQKEAEGPIHKHRNQNFDPLLLQVSQKEKQQELRYEIYVREAPFDRVGP